MTKGSSSGHRIPEGKAKPAETDRRKMSVYLPEAIRAEVDAEAKRLDRSFSWILQKAWKVGREEIRKLSG